MTSEEKILDATQLHPAIKHKTIFETFENLREGEAFILQNDHDPIPLYYQLEATKGDIFSWDYLEKGPDVFKIRIGKKRRVKEEAGDENGEKVLDGICLDPAVKFQTIMATFDNLKEGEGFILKNDHDPKPLYYHLSAQHGDTFTWDYLQEGPHEFKIRIAKKVTAQLREQGAEKRENILDGIALDPAVKFQTIMKTFNDLKEGEHFILHNDHDPKPLFYQLSATHGDSFTWDYLKQGPDAFDIRIGKKALPGQPAPTVDKEAPAAEDFHDHIIFDPQARKTVRVMVAKDYRKAKVFRKHGLDCAWKGDRTLEEVAKEGNISIEVLQKELAAAEDDFSGVIPSLDYYHWDMAFLADYVLKTHHRYVRDHAEEISAIAEEVGKKHGKDFPELSELGSSVRPMIEDFIVHMSKEENVLFPAIKYMLGLLQRGEKQAGPGGDIARGIAKMEEEHDETKAYLQRFRQITNNYRLPVGACEAHKQLYRNLEMFENDSFLHVHLENNILFPKTIILERMISGK